MQPTRHRAPGSKPQERPGTGAALNLRLSFAALAVALFGLPASSFAVDVTLQANDGLGDSSFTSATNWSPGTAPNTPAGASLDYGTLSTAGRRIRTPDGLLSAAFGGLSLTIDGGSELMMKAANGGEVQVDDLRLLDGSLLTSGSDNTQTLGGNVTVEGVVDFNTRNSARTLIIESAISDGASSGAIDILQGTFEYAGTNTYTGDTTVASGAVLHSGANDAFSESSRLTVNGTLRMLGTASSVEGLAGSGVVLNSNLVGGAGELGVVGSTSNTFTGDLQDGTVGTLALRKSGSGTQTIDGSGNTYSGGTVVEQGTLKATGTDPLGAGGVTVTQNGSGVGVLELDPVTIDNDLTLVGRSGSTPHVDATDAGNVVNGDIDLQDGGNDPNNFTLRARDSGDTLAVNGSVTDSSAGNDTLNLAGDGDGSFSATGAITMSGAGSDVINKTGSGTWQLGGGATSDSVNVEADGGELVFGSTVTTGDVNVGTNATLSQDGSFISAGDQTGVATIDGTLDVNGADASVSALAGSGIIDNEGAGAATITLGNSVPDNATFSGTLQDTGSTLDVVKSGSNTQTLDGTTAIAIDGSVAANAGTLEVTGDTIAAGGIAVGGGDASFSGAVTTTAGDLAVTSGTLDVSGNVTTTTGDLTVSGGTATLSGSNSLDEASVSGGTLNVDSSGALGGSGDTSVSGSGQVRINNAGGSGLTLDEVIELFGRTSTTAHLVNVASANSITQVLSLEDGVSSAAESYTITSETGTLALTGISSSLAGDDRTLRLGGDSAGVNTVGALNMSGGAANSITKFGDTTWRIDSGVVQDADLISTENGTLALTADADIDGFGAELRIASGATLDVTGTTTTYSLDDGQTLTGGGTVAGDLIADLGASVSPGVGTGDIDTLAFSGLDLDGTLVVDVDGSGAGSIDLLDISGAFDITGGALEFNVLNALNDMVYIFAQYGSITGSFGSILNQPTGYDVVVNYDETNQIALVRQNQPVPVPAPIALIGLGALALGARLRAFGRQRAAR